MNVKEKPDSLKDAIDNFLVKPKTNPLIENKEFMSTIKENNDLDDSSLYEKDDIENNKDLEKEWTIMIPKKNELEYIVYNPDYFNSIGFFNIDVYLSDDERNITSNEIKGGTSVTSKEISMPFKYFTYLLNQRFAPIPISSETKISESTTTDNNISPEERTKIKEDKIISDLSFSDSIAQPEIIPKPETVKPDIFSNFINQITSFFVSRKTDDSNKIEENISWIFKIKSKREPQKITVDVFKNLIYEQKEDVLDSILNQVNEQKKRNVLINGIYRIDDRFLCLGEDVIQINEKDDIIRKSIQFVLQNTDNIKPGTKIDKYNKKYRENL